MEEKIAEVCQALKRPAGDSELFASPAIILRNHEAFVRACHQTWKQLHETAVQQIETHEGFLQREKSHPLGPAAKNFGEYNRAVWRRVNDAIVWSVLGDRHKVKRLCLYKKRNELSECNPASVKATLAQLNSNPLSLALWNDATSCVDIGDVMYIENGLKPVPKFLELKEGTVNSAIVDVLRTDGANRDTAVREFRDRFGGKGISQLDRVLRQKTIAEQAVALLENDQGIDPLSKMHIRVVDTAVIHQSYDDGLNALLERVAKSQIAEVECVDGCLWIFAAAGGIRSARNAAAQFRELLTTRVSGFAISNHPAVARWDRDAIRVLSASVNYPIAKPLFLRGFGVRHVASLTYGALQNNVLMYLDWDAFGRLIEKAGGKFRWGSQRDSGRARAMNRHVRPPLIRGRVPQVHADKAIAYISNPNLVEIFYDGVTPWTIAQQVVEQLHRALKDHDQQSFFQPPTRER